MSPAKVIWALQSALGVAAAAVLALSLAVGLSSVTFGAPSAAALAGACRSFALPDATFAAVSSLALGSLAVAVLMLAGRSASRQLRASRRFLRTLTICGRGPEGLVLFEDVRPQAFCAGLLRPRVYLSTGAVRALSAAQLAAVVAHEAHHARLRDPLRVLIARVLSDALFFLPAVRRLAERYSALAELAADGAAVRARGAQPLASALLAFEAADPVVVGIAPERVDHLLGERPAWELPLALIAWAVVVLTAVAVIALRLEAAEGMSPLSVPLFAAELCMVAMAVAPLVVGAGALLGGRVLLTRRAR
ncbi:MAG: M56 family metallopeptidase [Solirubrobacteraceae bacterium]